MWKPTGHPVVHQQRDRWVVRVNGIETSSGKARPRQLGTFRSRRAAQRAASEFGASGEVGSDRSTVGYVVTQWAESRTDIGNKSRQQYEWAARHISEGIGSVRLDRLDRADIARWLEDLAQGGHLSRRSISICRTVLRAALTAAVEAGELRRSPANRVAMPRNVVKVRAEREVDAWDQADLQRLLAATSSHRWSAPLRLAALYGLRRSELLGLPWSAVDVKAGTVRIEQALIEVSGKVEWSPGKNERSRRTIPIDPATAKALAAHRRFQAEERMAAGPEWIDMGLVVTSKTGNRVAPSNFDQTLARLVKQAGVPRLTSHGLRHTAATHMVRHAADLGEMRAAADLLGHSPDMLMKVYAHALPESVRTVTDKIGQRGLSES
jgi:integrase